MSERYKHWKKVFKDINQRSPTKGEIASLAPPVIQEELRASEEREREEKSKSRRSSSIKLSRSFDERDYLPELALKKRRTSAISRSTSATSPIPTSSMPGTSGATSPVLRRSPRKHPSSSYAYRPPSPQKNISPQKRSASRNLNKLEGFQHVATVPLSKAFEDYALSQPEVSRNPLHFHSTQQAEAMESEPSSSKYQEQPSSGKAVVGSDTLVLPVSQKGGAASLDTEEQTQYLRRSPRKHPSSSSSGPVSFPSPQKPTLLSRPIATSSRLFNLLGSEDSLPGTSSATDDNVGFKEMPEKETDESDSEDENSRPFADEGGVVRRRKNENYRRLNMKRRYLHGTSDSKNKFKKWRRERKKR